MIKKVFLGVISVVFAFFLAPSCFNFVRAENNLEEINITSKAAILYDAKSESVIYEKNSNERLQIASMTKLASLMLVFEAIETGNIREEDVVRVSKHAADTEGSSAFLDENSEYKVCDLIMTVIVCSANDSTVALAEKVYGSEDNFVKEMNKKVRALGLKNTNFINCTGLPALDHYSTAYDISKIYTKICDNPLYKKYSKIWMTELKHPSGRITEIVNTNRLIKTYDGCDSGKTGFTNDAGYCLSASATRGDMRLIGVVIGATNSKVRFNEMAKLFDEGFNNYQNKVILNRETPLYELKVENSDNVVVKVYPKTDFIKFLKKGEEFKYSLDYKSNNVKAPLIEGDVVGKLFVLNENNIVVFEEDLIVKQNVEDIKVKDILIKIYKNMLKVG